MTGAAERPPIGARVRVRAGTGIRGISGREGTVVAYHGDGVALRVRIEGTGLVIGDPENFELLDSPAPYVPSDDPSPARIGGTAT